MSSANAATIERPASHPIVICVRNLDEDGQFCPPGEFALSESFD
jgi:hypothetical protein